MAVTGAGLEGIIAAESSICYIDGQAGILSYQGYNIHTLAENATFEEVMFLLWNGRLPKQAELDELKAALVKYRPIPAPVIEFPARVFRRSSRCTCCGRPSRCSASTIRKRTTCRRKRTCAKHRS